MIIQSRMQPPRVAASNTWTDDDGDDDPWSGYGDTLEMELTPKAAAAASEETYQPTAEQPIACAEPENDFAAACARLQQRGQDLHQQHVRQTARRQNPVPHYFPHLENGQSFGHGLTGRGYAPSHIYAPAPTPVRHTPPPPAPVHQAPAVPQVIQVEPDPQGLPYEIDAYGNPILPEGMELDAWGNLVPDNAYYRNY